LGRAIGMSIGIELIRTLLEQTGVKAPY